MSRGDVKRRKQAHRVLRWSVVTSERDFHHSTRNVRIQDIGEFFWILPNWQHTFTQKDTDTQRETDVMII